MALVSVIIPCYNIEKYIDRTMTSIINQIIGFNNIEIICVDDASSDNTVNKLKEWEKKYPDNILVVCCEENGRQGTARNIGLSYATSEYIAFIDGDDWIEPDYLSVMYSLIKEYNLDVVTCGIRRDSSNCLSYFEDSAAKSSPVMIDAVNDDVRKKLIMTQPFGGACCKLINKNFLLENKIYYPEGLAYEDLYWRETFHLLVNRGIVIDNCLYHYYVNNNSTTLKKNEAYHLDYFVIVTKLWDYWKSHGFVDRYKNELEYEYMIIAGLQILKVLVLRFDTPQYELYKKLQIIIRERIPDITNNPYINSKYFTEMQLIIIRMFYANLSENDYLAFSENIKKAGL